MNYHRDSDYIKSEAQFRNIFAKRFGIIKRFVQKKGRVLEIGCSTGTFLDLFKDDGWDTWGVEPSGTAARAKEKGHRVLKSSFESANLDQNYFDLVTANHTLEHMDDPLVVLKKVNRILKKNGIVFIDVPNAGGLAAGIMKDRWAFRLPLEHKHQFTRENLSKLMTDCGFEVLHFESRSGIFEYASPFREMLMSLIGLRKRFITNIISLPFSLIATMLNMGDSMSLVAKKR